jgi:hypothetical protein
LSFFIFERPGLCKEILPAVILKTGLDYWIGADHSHLINLESDSKVSSLEELLIFSGGEK